LINSPPEWAWIEHHNTAEDSRATYMAWTLHYNGKGELSTDTAIAKSKLEDLHYENKCSMSFECCTEIMTKCFNTLHKDLDHLNSNHQQKVEKLLKAPICCWDLELLVAKVIVDQNYHRNSIGTCKYFLQQVTRTHGPVLLEYRQSKNKKKHGIYTVDDS
jgi:hypothetical protein